VVYDEGLIVGLCMHDCKSLCAAIMIYAILVNTQHFDQLYEKLSELS